MQNQFVDLYRNGIKTAAQVAKTSLEHTVRLQEKQLDIVRNILQENSRSADRLTEARNLEDLVAVQSRLAGHQLERMAEFWSTLWQAAAENQKAMIDHVQSQIGFAADGMRESAAFTTHASEDVARAAANQASRAAGAIAAQERPRKSA